MLRKTTIVLALAAALTGGLTADAVALATAHTGWDGLGDGDGCARQSWRDPAGGSPAQVRSSVRLVASVAWPLATVVAKRTQRLHGVWD